MVGFSKFLMVAACTLFSATSALPAAAAGIELDLVERDPVANPKTITRTATGVNGHVRTHTTTRTHTPTKTHTPRVKTHTKKAKTHTRKVKTHTTKVKTHTTKVKTHTTKVKTTPTLPTTTPTVPVTTPTTTPTVTVTTPTTSDIPTTITTPTVTLPTTTTTTPTTTSPTATNTAAPGTCAFFAFGGGQYDDSNGVTYNVGCGFALAGNPYTTKTGSNYEACFPLCDANPACTGFSWVPGTVFTPASCALFDISLVFVPSLVTDSAIVVSR